jgi:TonB family protein
VSFAGIFGKMAKRPFRYFRHSYGKLPLQDLWQQLMSGGKMKYLARVVMLTFVLTLLGSFTAILANGDSSGDKELNRQPEIISQVTPTYPLEAQQKGIEGKVKIKAMVDAMGKPSQVEVAQTSGDASLDQAALEAAKQMKFAPALQDGKPVEASIAFDVTFALGPKYEGNLPEPDDAIAVDVIPEMIHQEMPVFPQEAEQQGITGVVAIRMLVGTDGKPVRTTVAKSSGYDFLDKSALTAAEKCTFKPVVKGGQPVAVWVSYDVRFAK